MARVECIQFDEVDERVRSNMHHPFLTSSNVRQSVSRFHFDVANTILQAASVPLERATCILESILLLHEGLSVHDYVDNQPEILRQLHVLTGDYSSSRYYWVLAKVRDNELLKKLSDAIVRINEAKMWVMSETDLSAERFIELKETVEGALLFSLAEHFLSESLDWKPYVRSLVKGHIVKQETSGAGVPAHFTFRQAYEWLTDSIERVRSWQTGQFFEPIKHTVMDYLIPIKNRLESRALTEGNR